jgi:hypothetical protein
VQRIPDQILFDVVIEGRVCHEAGRLIDFD